MPVDDLGVGRLLLLARQRRNWRQVDVARAAEVSQQLVSVAESGALERMTLRSLRALAAAVDVRLPFAPRWHGGEADRLRDRDHAVLVESVVRALRRHDWEVIVEYTFSHFGERGSVDIVAWHAATSCLLVVQVKTRIYDVQDLLVGLDRKARLVPRLLGNERGWVASAVGRVVVVADRTANRSLVARHSAVFDASLPTRSSAVRAWVRTPRGPLSGLWFLSSTTVVGGMRTQVGRQRVRKRMKARSTTPGGE